MDTTMKADVKDKIHVIFVYADSAAEWNCSQWRSLTPSSGLNRAGHKAKLIHHSGFLNYLDPAIQDLVAPADVIVFQRNIISEQAIDALQYWQGMGKPVAIDLDDAYQMLPWSNPAHKFWFERLDGEALKLLERGLSHSDGLMAPNRLLLSDWSHCTRGFYLQNYAETSWWDNLPSRKSLKGEQGLDGKIVIGWGGSVSHYDSWWGSGILKAARGICKRHKDVVWMICGNDARIYHDLPVPMSQKMLQPGVPPEQWPKIVKHFDIGVAPLFGPYDQRRSWIKGTEYLLAGVPWIGTEGEPYQDIANFGTLVQPGLDAWEDAIEDMIVNLRELQAGAREFMPQAKKLFTVDDQAETIATAFRAVKGGMIDEKGRLPGITHVG